MNKPGVLAMRADAGSRMGAGHVMRSLALGQAWRQAGGRVIFLTRCSSRALLDRIGREDFELHILPHPHPHGDDLDTLLTLFTEAVSNAQDQAGHWIVLDGYHFDYQYQESLRRIGARTLVIDDYNHLDRYDADILLNQNIGAEGLNYPCPPTTRRLLGTGYVLLRDEFLNTPQTSRCNEFPPRRVLVTLGGSDPDNTTIQVLCALDRLENESMEVAVVVGPSNAHAQCVAEMVQKLNSKGIHTFRVIRGGWDMPSLMDWADAAVTAAGSTCWELAYMGVPFATIILAENQVRIASGLEERGVANCLGRAQHFHAEFVAQKLAGLLKGSSHSFQGAEKEKGLVDGQGRQRVICAMLELA